MDKEGKVFFGTMSAFAPNMKLGRLYIFIQISLLVLSASLESSWAAGGKNTIQSRAATSRKFEKVRVFRAKLPEMQRQMRQVLDLNQPDAATAVATIVETMRLTGMRVGSARYANRRNGDPTFGASSLRKEHVTVNGDTVRLQFRGKSTGKKKCQWDISITDPKLARAYQMFVQQSDKGPLFEVKGKRGPVVVNDAHVRRVLKHHEGWPHGLRYIKANDLLQRELAKLPQPRSKVQAEENLRTAIAVVAKELRHSDPKVTEGHYLDPSALDAYKAGLD